MNHIELFAGCGGLSLGLEQAGLELVLANELSPMAAETFAYNLLSENLEELSRKNHKPKNVFWITSQFEALSQRLRENPFTYPEINKGYSDLPNNAGELKGKLVVGNIIHLNQVLESNKKLKYALRKGFGTEGVDLVSGGPPCQSFSLAGLRRKDCEKNTLPWEFANFVEHIQPKFVVLENVSGILRAFKEDGVSYHAWFEIAKVFTTKGYIPLCLHINARQAGVPQNRPRFIMLGVRKNVFSKIQKKFNDEERFLFLPGERLFKAMRSNTEIDIGQFKYFDSTKESDTPLFRKSFLHELVDQPEVSVKEAIHDLRFKSSSRKSNFVNGLNQKFTNIETLSTRIENHEPRNNNALVQRRFRIYQILQKCSRQTSKEVLQILKTESESLTNEAWLELQPHLFLSQDNKYIEFSNQDLLIKYFKAHPTKKQTQKALDARYPAPAALSIPDDACHYDAKELRTLTVREMARIQSFPDSFVFRSKTTTGGKMRRFEVPQYTQVGNAVPPLLGYQLGLSLRKLSEKLT